MKKLLYSLIILAFLVATSCKNSSSNLVNAFAEDGKIIVQYDNGTSKEIALKDNTFTGFSRANNIIIYYRIVQKSKIRMKDPEGGGHDQFSVFSFNPTTNEEKILFTTCLDYEDGGTKLDYANSEDYPFDCLYGLERGIVSPDGERLYFQTYAWATCSAIHYYNFKACKLVFFRAGCLENVTAEGIEVVTTGIEMYENNQGEMESKGRYLQNCLFDTNVNLMKELSPKKI